MTKFQAILHQNPALFLDRDGVINVRPLNDYVKDISEFKFIEGVIESIALLSEWFSPIIVVTNQQGIGKGVMTAGAVEEIHQFMIDEIIKGGGKIDKVYYCPHLRHSNSFFRKPAIGMGLLAKKEFPEIRFKDAVMIGDMITDMIFGKRLKMNTVLIDSETDNARLYPHLIDLRCNSLKSFTECILSFENK